MENINQDDFTLSCFALLEETFEKAPVKTGGFYLDADTSLFATIDKLSGEQASTSVGENEATIASHLEHIRFYLTVLKEFISQNETDVVDWKQSWLVNTVDESEWEELKKAVGNDYRDLKETLKKFESWNEKKIAGAMAIVTHSAYHLGAIRQIIKIL